MLDYSTASLESILGRVLLESVIRMSVKILTASKRSYKSTIKAVLASIS